MPQQHKRWSCNRCHKRFQSYGEAEKCELDHIVTDSTEAFEIDLTRIMGASKKRRLKDV